MSDFGLYIHWPFCLKKCPYCDFNSYAFEHDPIIWVESILQEMTEFSKIFPNLKARTIFLGGGTPSLIPSAQIKRILDLAKEYWVKEDIEITIEINPSSLEAPKLEEFLEAGVNRFSIGMQSLSDENLKFLGRLHNSKEAVEILTEAARVCDNVSADFIYALPKEGLDQWKVQLEEILELANRLNLRHLSLYQLTIEPGTAFESFVNANLWQPMPQDLQGDLYTHTRNRLEEDGWDLYEISNAAKQKWGKRSLHNLGYWEYKPYLGVGPGAHSRMYYDSRLVRFFNKKNPYKWQKELAQEFHLSQKEDFGYLSAQERVQEKLLMGLRLKDGIKLDNEDLKHINLSNLNRLIEHKFLEYDSVCKTTERGALLLSSILKMLFE